jgi:hypothetical protein
MKWDWPHSLVLVHTRRVADGENIPKNFTERFAKQRALDALECLGYVFVGVTQSDRTAVWAGGWMLGFSEGVE